ncbi:sugar kinase [Variovorax sp. PCZ-1]|uniref:sugar kinase n=1 Tax=Variovorax sp. PCZ-1 TaxID=2835533 RepID=UPI001BCFDC38|nr:sugar kinase [Variovorax sp. PCZ-1]MBS7806161.1 sugar kinase [Variovorax sp. PCZ-1]
MKYDVIAIGEAMVEFNQTIAGEPNYLQGFGGDTSNAVIAAARAGARCAYVSAVGDDVFGKNLMDLWHIACVDTAQVAIKSGAFTGIYFVTHGAAGHEFSYRRAGSAATTMLLNDMQCGACKQTKWLHYSGISQAISENAREQCSAAARIARAAGAKISFDSNLRLKLWSLEDAKLHMIPAIAGCDLFLPSLDDVVHLSGLSDPQEIIRWSHDLGAKQVVLKMGSEGVIVSDGSQQNRIAPITVKALDATGAGDCFAGNLLARLALGDDLTTAARYANAAAALSVQGFGAVAPLPLPKAVHALLASHS